MSLSAFARCGIRRTELTSQHMEDAALEANYLQSDWSADGKRSKLIQLFRDFNEANTNPIQKCVVYVAVNKNNNKFYIGATQTGVRNRSRKHIRNALAGEKGKFYTAIRKHGSDAFEFLTLANCSDFFHALEVEAKAIAAFHPEYNLTAGGGGAKGYVRSEKSKAAQSAKMKGRISPRKGVTATKETKALIAKSATEWWQSLRDSDTYEEYCLAHYARSLSKANAARMRPVICIDTGEIFSCASEAAKKFGLRSNLIKYICDKPNYKPWRKKGCFRFKYVGGLK